MANENSDKITDSKKVISANIFERLAKWSLVIGKKNETRLLQEQLLLDLYLDPKFSKLREKFGRIPNLDKDLLEKSLKSDKKDK